MCIQTSDSSARLERAVWQANPFTVNDFGVDVVHAAMIR
jgi:hypothetical protein